MDSLHALIYGHEEQPEEHEQQAPVSANKQSRKRKLADNSNNNNHEPTVCSKEQPFPTATTTTTTVPLIVQRMNTLYHPSTTTTVTAISTDDDYYHSYLQELQASLNPPVVKQKKEKSRTAKNMTLERRAKQERLKEWAQIRRQWKKRQTNYREEEDVGGVLQQVFLQTSIPLPNETEEQDEEEPIDVPTQDAEIIDTSDEEEEAILRQLTQASGESEKKKKRKQEEDREREKKNDIFIPYPEKMNFYDRGLVQPDDLGPLQEYKRQKRAVAQQLSKNTTQYAKHPGEAITLRRIRVAYRLKEQESTFPPLNHNLYCSPQFAHKRQVLRLAARCLLSSGRHKDYRTNLLLSRLLQCLWSPDSLRSSNASLIRHLAEETATRYQTFWSHLWKNRGEMAETLGVKKDLQVAGPYVGFRLDPRGFPMMRQEMVKLKRSKSIRAISAGSTKSSKSRTSKTQDNGLLSTVSYAYTPGTKPPVPQHPLDESGIVLGPPDKFANYILNRVVIDEFTLSLTSAHLLAIFAANIKSNTSTEDICLQVQSMFRSAIDMNRKIANFATASTAEEDWPLPHVYRSWMGYLSFVMNGLLCLSDDSNSEQESDFTFNYGQSIDVSFLDDSPATYTSVKETAAELYQYYQQAGQLVGLGRFGDFHLSNALLRIAKDLPESAAQLLSRPSEEASDRMPFESMHSLLLHLEQGGMLTEKASKATAHSVSVIELEYAMYQASQIILKCIERDPTDLKFHCWHLATLSSSLLLCSGNEIGSGPCLEPSSCHEQSAHGVRQPLLKFHETRRETARALYLLLQLASKQRNQAEVALSSDVHLAVAKFLEWHEVVALLIGSPCRVEKIQALGTIHKYHSRIWAYSCVDTSQILSAQADDHSVRIEAAARALEQDPSCKDNWRVLALELGAVGYRPSQMDLTNKSLCVKKDCADCCILVQGSYMDHDQEKSDVGSTEWWGRDRKRWWRFCVLDLKNPAKYAIGLINRSYFHRTIEMGLSSISAHQPVARSGEEGTDAATLDTLYNTLTDVDGKHLEHDDIMSEPVAQYLPKFFTETLFQKEEHHDKEINLFPAFTPSAENDLVEVECYQIVVASHLYGPGHRWVQSKVLQLVEKSWDRKEVSLRQDSREWAALKWLYQMGISASNAVKMAVKAQAQKRTPKD